MTTIAKATVKGQITLPARWRKQFKTNQFLLTFGKNALNIKPIEKIITKRTAKSRIQILTLSEILKKEDESGGWGESVFNADRDNRGKGINADQFLKIIKKIDG